MNPDTPRNRIRTGKGVSKLGPDQSINNHEILLKLFEWIDLAVDEKELSIGPGGVERSPSIQRIRCVCQSIGTK
jgi:hypothetical protein